ncbi:unnamed protein product [Discosporangium mesarthrocarpum]
MKPELFALVLSEGATLVADTDLHLAHLSLKSSVCMLGVSPSSAKAVGTYILPKALVLSSSPLLQGLALRSLLEMFEV